MNWYKKAQVPADVYDFYYLIRAYSLIRNDTYKMEFLKNKLEQIKQRYLVGLAKLVLAQLEKYNRKRRIDPGFTLEGITSSTDPANLLRLHEAMQKTFRSDMERRNDSWSNLTENLYKLSLVSDVDRMFYHIDRINNAVHNTGTATLGKINPELETALNRAHNATLRDLSMVISKDVKMEISPKDVLSQLEPIAQ
jgi:hypothetical protein